jgi:hypothetical protein
MVYHQSGQTTTLNSSLIFTITTLISAPLSRTMDMDIDHPMDVDMDPEVIPVSSQQETSLTSETTDRTAPRLGHASDTVRDR